MPTRFDFMMPVRKHEITDEHYAPVTDFRLVGIMPLQFYTVKKFLNKKMAYFSQVCV